nr:protein FAR1-RELATED SEQUENCE 5-like [Ipomoea batatas]
MEFESEEAAKAFYNCYARRVGFSTRVSMSRRSRRDGAIIQRSFVCAKQGFRVDKAKPSCDGDGGRVKRPRVETRVGCKAMLLVKIQEESGKWIVAGFIREHNHELVPPDKVHCLRSHRHVSGAAKALIDTLQGAGMGASGIMSALIKEYGGINNIGFTERDCRNYMKSKCQEKLSDVLSKHPNFEAEFYKCVSVTESIEEFESCWLSLIDRYDLRENEWLKTIFVDRGQWVPVYLRNTFFAEMSMTQHSDSLNSYFDGYMNASTTLQQFVKQYEKALESRYEKEVKADYDSINTAPVLKTPSPMEKQASEIYTRKLFAKFQGELVETLGFLATKVEDQELITTYQVSKFGESHKSYLVRYNVGDMKALCSCQMFEFCGILCRHILTVFRITNLLTLPSQYILKRWTKNAKSSVMLDEGTNNSLNSSRESLTQRYNNLQNEALRYVDESAGDEEIYNVALDALREAANKVAIAKLNSDKLSIVNGPGDIQERTIRLSHANARSQDHQLDPEKPLPLDEQDRKIQSLSRQLEHAEQKCEAYRANLLSILKDIEQQKLQLMVKVQNIKFGLKD